MKRLIILAIILSTVSFSIPAGYFKIKTQSNLKAPYGSKVISQGNQCIFDKSFYEKVNRAGEGNAKFIIDAEMNKTDVTIDKEIKKALTKKEKDKISKEGGNIGSCYMYLRSRY